MTRVARRSVPGLPPGGLLLSPPACGRGRAVVGEGGLRGVTLEEVRASDADNVLELIEELRPSWLMGSPLRAPWDPTEQSCPLVLVNDVPPQPLFSLQYVPLDGVREIRYLTATYAETRYRIRAPDGAILVLRPPPISPVPPLRRQPFRRRP